MDTKGLIPPAILLVLILLAILTFDSEEGAYKLYVPVGYLNEVNRLIQEEKLVFDCATQKISLKNPTANERSFYDNSYLEDDVAAWNRGDRRPFFVFEKRGPGSACEGRLEAINTTYHNQRLPNYEPNHWKGDLYLRQAGTQFALTSPRRIVEVQPTPWDRRPLPARAYQDLWFRAEGQRAEVSTSLRARQMSLKMFERGRSFATFRTLGDHGVLDILQSSPRVELNACWMREGDQLRVDAGDTLRVHQPGLLDQRFRVEAGPESGRISFVSQVNGEPKRQTFDRLLPLAPEIVRAIDNGVATAKEEAEARDRELTFAEDFDVVLTLDRHLGQTLDRGLRNWCRKRYGRRPLRAAVTVLDPWTGRVLAMSSYPSTEDLEDLDLVDPSLQGALLPLNHNLLMHPAGSTAKPFLAAAALSLHPELADLRIPCVGDSDEPPEVMLGYDLGIYHLPGDCVGGGGRMIDFGRFLEVSSNRYVLYLGILALAEWADGTPIADAPASPLPESDRYLLGGRWQSVRPSLRNVFKEELGDGLTELKNMADQPFPQAFRRLFGAGISYQLSDGPVARIDAEPWRPVIEHVLGSVGSSEVMSYTAITPERVNLRTNQIQQLRQDLYTLLLGNGNNRWSNLQLAQAMARVVTGREITARLVESISEPVEGGEPRTVWSLADSAEAAAPWELDDVQRRLVLDGMTRVVEQGTAKRIGAALRKLQQDTRSGMTFRALGKTGSPSLDLATVRQGPTRPGPGAVKSYSGRNQVLSGALVLNLIRGAGGPENELVLTVFIEAQGGSEETVALTADLLRPLMESRWPEDWSE